MLHPTRSPLRAVACDRADGPAGPFSRVVFRASPPCFSGPGAGGRARARRRCASPDAGACRACRRRLGAGGDAADVEERRVDGVPAVRERRAEHAGALVAHVPAEARALVPPPGQVGDALQERVGHGPVARLSAGHQGLERVAAQQLVVQLGVLRRPRDEVETDHAGAVQHQHPLLAVLERERGQHGVQVALAGLVRVAHGPGGRRRHVPLVQRADLLPHAPLVRAMPRAGGEVGVHALLHRVPHLPVGDELALVELPGGVGPAPLLGAAHRHDQAAVPADQDAGVEDAVLLGAAQLLAVEHQHAPVALVDDAQLGHRPALAHLGDRGLAAGDGLPQRDVPRTAVLRQPQREHHQRSVHLRIAHLQRLDQRRAAHCLVRSRHDAPPSRGRSPAPIRERLLLFECSDACHRSH